MHSSPHPYPPLPPSPPPPSPPVPCDGIPALILVYVIFSYIIIDFIDQTEENMTGSVDLENTSSLDLEAALPRFEYEEADANIVCVICLDVLQKGERCRCLPVCSHVFHAKCIDLWLLNRLSCPICRSPFVFNCGLEAG